MDVEDLARLGQRRGACPYYAARAAMPEADLVLLPYAALLNQVGPPDESFCHVKPDTGQVSKRACACISCVPRVKLLLLGAISDS